MKTARSKALRLLVCLVLFSALLTSCSAGESDTSGSPSETATPTDSVLKVGVSGTPDLDPAIATTGSSIIAVVNLYDSLVFPSADGTIEPRVAESWNVSDDGLTYTFKIRQGIKFHNGSELKASDVAFSMNRLLTIGEGYAYLFTDFVESAEAIGDYEVEFRLKKTYGPFLSALVRLLIVSEEEVMANTGEGVYGEFGDYGRAYLTTHDAGSGAYKAHDLVQQDYFEAVKYDDWFVGWKDNAPEGFKLMAITEGATVRTMMNNRELDITDQWQSAENLAAMERMEGVSIGEFSTFLVQNMYMNTKLPPMDDINYRRAMCSLFDYDTICNDIFIHSVKSTGPVAAGVAGHVNTTTFSYDIEKAKEYLAASKYADNYEQFTVEMLVNSDVADLEKIALMFQAAAKDLGITVEISKAPWVSIIDRVGSIETTPHMLSINSAPSFNEAGTYLESRYHSKTMGTWEQGEWLGNRTLDVMIEDALATVDKEERFAKYADIQHYIVDELCPTAYLCDLTERLAYQSAYITWPAMENVGSGGVASALYGYLHIFSDIEVHTDRK